MAVQNNVKKTETREVISTTTETNNGTTTTTVKERVGTPGVQYDPSTGQWVNHTEYHEEESTSTSSSNANLKADSTDKDSAQGTNDAKENAMEMNTLSGTLQYIATPDTIQIKAGDTICLKGLGKYLSGNYYVKDVTRNISKDGYSHSATVVKTDYGDSLKSDPTSKSDKNSSTPQSNVQTKETSTSTSSGIKTNDYGANFRVYTVKEGDTPYLIAKRELGNSTLIGRLFDEKTHARLDITTQLKVGQEILIDD